MRPRTSEQFLREVARSLGCDESFLRELRRACGEDCVTPGARQLRCSLPMIVHLARARGQR